MGEIPALGSRDEWLKVPNRLIHSPRARAWLYRVGIALGGVLIVYGVVSREEAAQWFILLGAMLSGSNTVATANIPHK